MLATQRTKRALSGRRRDEVMGIAEFRTALHGYGIPLSGRQSKRIYDHYCEDPKRDRLDFSHFLDDYDACIRAGKLVNGREPSAKNIVELLLNKDPGEDFEDDAFVKEDDKEIDEVEERAIRASESSPSFYLVR